jgi:hypothetical protein
METITILKRNSSFSQKPSKRIKKRLKTKNGVDLHRNSKTIHYHREACGIELKRSKMEIQLLTIIQRLNIMTRNMKKMKKRETSFGSILSETFTDTDSHKYNSAFKKKIEQEMNNYYNHYDENYLENVNFSSRKVNKNVKFGNLNKFLKSIKASISSREDGINNLLLKNINNKLKVVLVHLFRIVIKTAKIPTGWKQVIVKMIPIKVDMKGRKGPKNYRPISLTNCLARLCDRLMLVIDLMQQHH